MAQEVRITVAAASVNPLDLLMAAGYGLRLFGLGPGGRLPLRLGRDGIGTVRDVGRSVRGLVPGDRVWFAVPPFLPGTFARDVTLPVRLVGRLPSRPGPGASALDEALALASLPYAGLTALACLDAVGAGRLAGRSVLVHGAGGGVGSVLVQLLTAAGARVVASAGPDAVDHLRRLGAAEIVDARGDEPAARADTADVLFDLVIPDDMARVGRGPLSERLPRGSHYVSTVTPLPLLVDAHGLLRGGTRAGARLAAARLALGRRGVACRWVLVRPTRAGLDRLATLVAAGALHPVTGRRFAFADLSAAFVAAATPPRIGKIVIAMDGKTEDNS